MFENLIRRLNEEPAQEQISFNLDESPILNPGYIHSKLDSINEMEDKELYNIIKESYDSILNDIFHRKDPKYLETFASQKFLTIMIQVLSSIPNIDSNDIIYANKLAYDYHTYKNNDPYIKQLFFILSKTVNKQKIAELMSIGLEEKLAAYIAMSRYSSFDEIINVKRMNFVIITSSTQEIMTLQTIVRIYEKLFNRLTLLLEGVMFDVLDESEEDEESEWITEDALEIYSTISLAILSILEDQPSSIITKVLSTYTADFKDKYSVSKIPVRFAMKSLSPGEYPRLTSIIESLSNEGIYVP